VLHFAAAVISAIMIANLVQGVSGIALKW